MSTYSSSGLRLQITCCVSKSTAKGQQESSSLSSVRRQADFAFASVIATWGWETHRHLSSCQHLDSAVEGGSLRHLPVVDEGLGVRHLFLAVALKGQHLP